MRVRFWVYIVASDSGTLYVGVTNDIGGRVAQHRAGEIEGFSKRHKCHRLVYFEEYKYVKTAIAREKELKGWTRAKKIALIEGLNPRWEDLSRNWGKELSIEPGLLQRRSQGL